MAYTLIGSYPSPFVRRIRMLMEDIPFEFRELNIYEAEGTIELNKVNPVNQIPVLIDGNRKIWDSRIIFNYLNALHKLQKMDWEDENTLTAIDGALNAGVALLLMKRSGIRIEEPYMIVNRHRERIESILEYLRAYAEGAGLKEWNFLSMSLYSFLDWASFREILNLADHPVYLDFFNAHSERDIARVTQIPRG